MTELLRERRDGMRGQVERRSYPVSAGDLELRAKPDGTGGDVLNFRGYASVTEKPYDMVDPWGDPYSEVVARGAFGRTLGRAPDVPFLVNHAGMTLARTKAGTMTLAEDDQGLLVDATLDPKNPQVQALASALERGDIDEMSFAFITRAQEWSPEYDYRRLVEVDIHKGDVSAVNYGANPNTSGGLRSLDALDRLEGDDLRAAFERLKRRLEPAIPEPAAPAAGLPLSLARALAESA